MPLTSNNPIVVEGVEYPYFTLNLAISPLVKTDDVGGSVAVKLTPFRYKDGNEPEIIQEGVKSIVHLDVFLAQDPTIQEASYSIMMAIQKFINENNL
jgi:hypothetical protein